MCDADPSRETTWRGWSPIPSPAIGGGTVPWQDIAHVLTEDLSRSPMFPRPRIEQIYRQPEYPANVTEIQMVCHHGTHVDAPSHFIGNGPSFDTIPLERLFGAGVVLQIDAGPNQEITPAMLAAGGPPVLRGDIVLLDTGWARRISDPDYEDHPFVSADAATWLAERGAKMLGVDFSTPDLGAGRRPPGYGFPVHNRLLRQGILIAEHVTNIETLARKRIEAIFLPLAIAGADGGPARAMARVADKGYPA